MGSRRPRMPGFGEDGGGRGWHGQGQGRGGRPGRGGFYPQHQQQYYQQGGGGGRGGGPYQHNGQSSAYQPRGAMPPAPQQQWRPAGPAPVRTNGGGPTATIAPELRQAMSDDAPREPAANPSASHSPEGSPPPRAALDAVAERLGALSVEDGAAAVVVVQPPIPMPGDSYKFPHRPGSGRAGTRCLVKANHFLAELPDKDLHQYDVAITPETTSRALGRAVMEELVRLHKATYLGGRLPAYDGRKSMYTAGPLPFTSKEFHITLLDEDDGSGAERRERTFKVVIRFAARADLRRLEQYIAGRQAEAPQEALQVLDIVLRELPTSRYEPYGRSFYSPDLGRRRSLGDGVESWRGFYQTIRPTQMGLSLNIEIPVDPVNNPVVNYPQMELIFTPRPISWSSSSCLGLFLYIPPY